MRVLTLSQRLFVRTIAREVMLQANGNKDMAIELGKARLRDAPRSIILTILLPIAIRLLVALIIAWVTNGVSEPASSYQKDEPGYEKWDEADNAEYKEVDDV